MEVYGILKRAQLEHQTVAPTGINGRVYFDTASGQDFPKFYRGTSTEWRWFDLPKATGTRASPTAVADTGITPAGVSHEIMFVNTAAGAVDVTANPQIVAGTVVGQRLTLIGTSDANYPYLENATGLDLNGPCNITSNQVLQLMWDGTNWREMSRRSLDLG